MCVISLFGDKDRILNPEITNYGKFSQIILTMAERSVITVTNILICAYLPPLPVYFGQVYLVEVASCYFCLSYYLLMCHAFYHESVYFLYLLIHFVFRTPWQLV